MTELRRIHTLGEQEVEYLAWSDQDLAEMSVVSDKDRSAADRYSRRLLPKHLRDLLDAVREDRGQRRRLADIHLA